AIRRYRV
ncbi:hypothetical protein VTL71DRAFT_10337, partial [Oculimacula yallundae]